MRRVGRAGAERGVARVAVAPPPPAAQPGGTPSVTWRPPGSPREARGPRDPRRAPGRAGCCWRQSGHPQGSRPGRCWSSPPPCGAAGSTRGQSGVLLALRGGGGSRASPRWSPPVVSCRIPGWTTRHPTHPNLRKVELLSARSTSPALPAFTRLCDS